MRSKLRFAALLALAGGFAAAPGCTDRLPTFSGDEGFPEDLIPTSIEYVLEAEDFLRSAAVYDAGTTVDEFPGLIVAKNFDGPLNAHVVVDPGVFPDTIQFNGAVDSTFVFDSGLVTAIVPDTLDVSSSDLSFYLWELTESFEADSATWENRIDRPGMPVRWQQPGGTRGALIGIADWNRSEAGAAGDSLKWTVPGSVMTRLANDALPGFLVTLEDNGERAGISRLALTANIRPTARPDTVVTRNLGSGDQAFIFTPQNAPTPAGVLRVGGLRSERTVLRINLPATLPGCAAGLACAPVSPTQISINRVDLELETVPVTGGFRPLTPGLLAVRRVFEPELGSRAPLGPFVGVPVNSATGLPDVANFPNYFQDQFIGGRDRVSLVISGAVANAYAAKETELGLALLVEPEASRFDVAWFTRQPKLRIIYTLPQTPELP